MTTYIAQKDNSEATNGTEYLIVDDKVFFKENKDNILIVRTGEKSEHDAWWPSVYDKETVINSENLFKPKNPIMPYLTYGQYKKHINSLKK